ncbi:hypothetical protein [Poseidonocella sp. HB161398]|nr:hypothetical protein [Poseidonocella sp. HB161398]
MASSQNVQTAGPANPEKLAGQTRVFMAAKSDLVKRSDKLVDQFA